MIIEEKEAKKVKLKSIIIITIVFTIIIGYWGYSTYKSKIEPKLERYRNDIESLQELPYN